MREAERPAQVVTAAELRSIGLFGALPDPVLEHLSENLEVMEVTPGTVLFHEADPADDMFVVLQGELEVLKKSRSGQDSRVAMLGERDWFGEMSIVDVQPRSATVRALSPARLVRLTASDLDALYRYDVKAYSLVLLNIAREMSRRLRVADGILADMIADLFDNYINSTGGKP